MIRKVRDKVGASDMVVALIMIVIFSSVGLFVFKGIGASSKGSAGMIVNSLNSAENYSEVTSSGGEYGENLVRNNDVKLTNPRNLSTVSRGLDIDFDKIRGKTVTVSYDYDVENALQTHSSVIRLGLEGAYNDGPPYIAAWTTLPLGGTRKSKAVFTVNIQDREVKYINAYLQVGGDSVELSNIKIEAGREYTN